jgi:hypothetical protein
MTMTAKDRAALGRTIGRQMALGNLDFSKLPADIKRDIASGRITAASLDQGKRDAANPDAPDVPKPNGGAMPAEVMIWLKTLPEDIQRQIEDILRFGPSDGGESDDSSDFETSVKATGLRGRDLEELNRAMGIHKNPTGHRIEAGRLVMPSLTPTQARARAARGGPR